MLSKSKGQKKDACISEFCDFFLSSRMKIVLNQRHRVVDRFKELGYIDEDLIELAYQDNCRGKAQLTDKSLYSQIFSCLTTKSFPPPPPVVWNRIRPMLEPGVKERKARRLGRELASIKRNRRCILSARYTDFQRTLHPSQWRYLPKTLEISAFEPFARHIEADVEVEVDRTTFDDAFLALPNLLATATEQRKVTLRTLMDGTLREDGGIGLEPLDLATAVFQCSATHTVFGWDEIATHHCLPGLEDWSFYPYPKLEGAPVDLKYSPKIANIVRKVAQLVGLDATTATAADFDEKNLRFGCDSCTGFIQSGRYYRFGYSWRTLVNFPYCYRH